MESVRENERVAREHYDLTLLVDIFSTLISCAREIIRGENLEFLVRATILLSNTSVQDSVSRFEPALRLSGRSWAESAAFGALQLNPGSTLVYLGESVQWVNQPMVHLLNRSTGLDQSMPVNSSQPPVKSGQPSVNGGQRWSTFFLSSSSSQ
ncbi:hypothetical protein PIB30_066103 [Stylosanthes scabra]|uniref:Uncharacterized protein n=1 Tax=Stylosanthes scabra TaxID=79078 RepID=A0ABU6SN70_9FABA|nr:hypothetical protein [Stylosanthes scabra]